MKKFNGFYIALIISGICLFFAFRPDFYKELSFYGFAESRATEINYNYPVVVDKILVKPGQEVKAGQVLLHLSRRKSKETLEDQSFRIAELKAEEALWKQKLNNRLEELALDQRTQLAEIEGKIVATQKELAYKKSLMEDLEAIQPVEAGYKPLEERLERYREEKAALDQLFAAKIKGVNKELSLGRNPYRQQINRFMAEKEFDESQKVQPIVVTAPIDGLVGNISCKEAEHISSYSTLMTFYEPHSGIIKGFVHEDLTLEVDIGQKFTISSLKDEEINYPGTVIGLGSRIVEIPSRLRKVETVKAYGREVLIEISKENTFLQKEKVSIKVMLDDGLTQ
ncbi:MAG: HlyD family efflux transporter periplasmic adaptor subunit [Bacteroidota bacterium]